VPVGRAVEGGGDHLAEPQHLHLGDLLRPLVDEQHQEQRLRVVGGDPGDDRLQEHRLARARGRHDQRALPLAERRDQVDDAVRVVAALPREAASRTSWSSG
jgi:hypothetical protein